MSCPVGTTAGRGEPGAVPSATSSTVMTGMTVGDACCNTEAIANIELPLSERAIELGFDRCASLLPAMNAVICLPASRFANGVLGPSVSMPPVPVSVLVCAVENGQVVVPGLFG